MKELSDGVYDVAVVGGGMDGMLISIALAKNGNRVILIEKENDLGGFFLKSPFKKVGIAPYLFKALPFFEGLYSEDLVRHLERLSQAYIFEGKAENLGGSLEDFERFLKKKFPSELEDIARFFLDVKKCAFQTIDILISNNGLSLAALKASLGARLSKGVASSLQEYLERNIKNEEVRHYIKKESLFMGVEAENVPFGFYALSVLINDGGLEFSQEGAKILLRDIAKEVGDICEVKKGVKVRKILVEKGAAHGVECIDQNKSVFTIKASKVISAVSAFNANANLIIDAVASEDFDIEDFALAISDACFYRAFVDLKSSALSLGLEEGYNVVYVRNRDSEMWTKPEPEKLFGIELADQIVIKTLPGKPERIQIFACCFSKVSADNFREYFINNFKEEVKEDLLNMLDSRVPGLKKIVSSFSFLDSSEPDVDSVRVFRSNPKNYGVALMDAESGPEDHIRRNLKIDYENDLQVEDIAQRVYGFPMIKERLFSPLVRIEGRFENLYYCGKDVFAVGISGSILGSLMFSLFLAYGYSSAQVYEEIGRLVKDAVRYTGDIEE